MKIEVIRSLLKTPPASVLLANAAEIKKGSSTPNKIIVGSITKNQLEGNCKNKITRFKHY